VENNLQIIKPEKYRFYSNQKKKQRCISFLNTQRLNKQPNKQMRTLPNIQMINEKGDLFFPSVRRAVDLCFSQRAPLVMSDEVVGLCLTSTRFLSRSTQLHFAFNCLFAHMCVDCKTFNTTFPFSSSHSNQ
jgi:hypothetical protein